MGDGLESQAAAFKSFMASKEEKGEKNDMFFGTMSKEEREKEDRDAAAPSKEDVKEESEKDKKKKKKLPKPPPVIEDEKALKKRNVKRDMLRLRKSGAADGLRGQSQMETLRHEFQKRTRHVAEKNLAQALDDNECFEYVADCEAGCDPPEKVFQFGWKRDCDCMTKELLAGLSVCLSVCLSARVCVCVCVYHGIQLV